MHLALNSWVRSGTKGAALTALRTRFVHVHGVFSEEESETEMRDPADVLFFS